MLESWLASLGCFLEMMSPSWYYIDKSLQIRVNIDVRKPLVSSIKLKIRGGFIFDIPVKYERLTMIFFITFVSVTDRLNVWKFVGTAFRRKG